MSTTDSPCVIADLREQGQLLHLTLNAPKGNILDSKMLAGIGAALDEYSDGPALKAIAFEGAGKHFCFGASVEEHRAAQAADMLATFHALFRRLAKLGIPTFAIVRGQCLGGGLELASYCSWIFSNTTAKFGQPEIKLAVFPPMASVLLPWRLGAGRALDLCVSGRSIGAEEAVRIGLVHDASEDPSAAFAAFFAEHFHAMSSSSLRFAERAVRLPLAKRLDEDLAELETLYLEQLMQTPDANEGITAFLEKRPPVYAGTAHN
jgi:cyclohexa-1,5-dienecarbonyl-CoA hydratase